jgi:hypothetical protein
VIPMARPLALVRNIRRSAPRDAMITRMVGRAQPEPGSAGPPQAMQMRRHRGARGGACCAVCARRVRAGLLPLRRPARGGSALGPRRWCRQRGRAAHPRSAPSDARYAEGPHGASPARGDDPRGRAPGGRADAALRRRSLAQRNPDGEPGPSVAAAICTTARWSEWRLITATGNLMKLHCHQLRLAAA